MPVSRTAQINCKKTTKQDACVKSKHYNGTNIAVGGKVFQLNVQRRVHLGGIGRLDFKTDTMNVFWGCEVVAHHRPLHVVLTGTETQVVAQYLLSTGYQTQDQLNYTR